MKLKTPVNWFLDRKNYFWIPYSKPIEILFGTITDISNCQFYNISSGVFFPYIPFSNDVTSILGDRYPAISEKGKNLYDKIGSLINNFPEY